MKCPVFPGGVYSLVDFFEFGITLDQPKAEYMAM